MHIKLSPEIEQYLQTKVSTGFYSNASEVVCDAIRRMAEDDERIDKLRAAVLVGEIQIEHGEGLAYSASRLETITKKALNNARQGKIVNNDVTP